MNDMTVGMENLPNVFIDKIEINKTTDDKYEIDVHLKMFDYAEDHSWYGKIDGLNVKCVFVSDLEKALSLDNGEVSLYDMLATERHPSAMIESCDEFGPVAESEAEGYETYTKMLTIVVPQPNNLNVYVACFIDGLDFGIPQFDKFYGPMAAERIFVGGIPNQESGYFYNPETNEEYGGPVHQHSSGYMEGSEHIDAAHDGLRYVSEDNFKMIVGAGIETEPALEETAEEEPSPFNDTAPYDPSSPNQSVAPPSGFSSAAEYEAYLLSQTAQQPNFNLVGNPTTINNPTGY